MTTSALRLRPIGDLLGEQFFIPSYQRGYRWSSRQVTDLLDDILKFNQDFGPEQAGAFYCLQPIVVRRRTAGDWELVDGQQRLTTLFLILKVLKRIRGTSDHVFGLKYETRPDSGTFLEDLDVSRMNNNVDYYYIGAAYQTIEQWISGTNTNDRQDALLRCLLNTNDRGPNVRVIWYELPAHDKPVSAFIRLNGGKIPLTSAELIRALFLRSQTASDAVIHFRQLQIATEWDRMERAFQADDFWYFINGGDESYSTRIEFLFRIIAQQNPPPDLNPDDEHFTFFAYHRLFENTDADLYTQWDKVTRYFMTWEEWFRDRELYHLIGFLIFDERDVLKLMRWAVENPTKSAFRHALKSQIFSRLFHNVLDEVIASRSLRAVIHDTLVDLSYDEGTQPIRSALLLFNIATILQNRSSRLRFPFDCFRKEKWDLEHIRSVTSDKPGRQDLQKKWLEDVLRYWDASSKSPQSASGSSDDPKLYEDINTLLTADRFSDDQFEALYSRVLKVFREDDASGTDNGLKNLTLLNASTNRSFKNAVFPIKRREVLNLDRRGVFVPLCTTNVFLKYYSTNINNMLFWTEDDRKDYFDAIVDVLESFFASTEVRG